MEECIIGAPLIAATVYAAVTALKEATADSERVKRFIPLIAFCLGMALGLFAYCGAPALLTCDDPVTAAILGALSGLAATGSNQMLKQLFSKDEEEDGKQ